ncbi:MAG: hypothetical protein JWQ10_3817 [Herbaspirillum sp.]|nr:hypothetical protein [Herbaspirillum sp.]
MNFPTLSGLQPMLPMPLNNAAHTPLPHNPNNPHNPILPSRHAGNASFADRAREIHYRYKRLGPAKTPLAERQDQMSRSDPVQRRIHNIDQHLYQRWRALGSFNQADGIAVTNDHQFNRTDRVFIRSMTALNRYSEPFPDMDESTFESLYSGVIERGLRWAASERIADWSAADVLAAVCHHRDEKCDSQRMRIGRTSKPNDVIFDEAAQLYRLTIDPAPAPASMAAIRACFFTALCDNWQDAALGQHLLPSMPIAPDHGRFRYDGGVLHAAVNLGLDAVVDRLYEKAPSLQDMTAMRPLMTLPGRHLAGQPDGLISAQRRQDLIDAFLGSPNTDTDTKTPPRYNARPGAKQIGGVYLTSAELRTIVKETMRMLALDTQFTIGTPFHSIACTALRIGPLQGVDISNNPQSLLPDFAALNQRWHADPQTPTEPWLAAAYHCCWSIAAAAAPGSNRS